MSTSEMAAKLRVRTPTFNPKALLKRVNGGKSISIFRRKHVVFSQGDPADRVYYLQKGRVRLTVVSKQGKQAVVGFVVADMFFGEGCLAGQQVRMVRRPPWKNPPSSRSKNRS